MECWTQFDNGRYFQLIYVIEHSFHKMKHSSNFGHEFWNEAFGQGDVVHNQQHSFGPPHTPLCFSGLDLLFVALPGFFHQQLGHPQDLFTLLGQFLTMFVKLYHVPLVLV